MKSANKIHHEMLGKIVTSPKYIRSVVIYLGSHEAIGRHQVKDIDQLICIEKGKITLLARHTEAVYKKGDVAIIPAGVTCTIKNNTKAIARILIMYIRPLNHLFSADDFGFEDPYNNYFYSNN